MKSIVLKISDHYVEELPLRAQPEDFVALKDRGLAVLFKGLPAEKSVRHASRPQAVRPPRPSGMLAKICWFQRSAPKTRGVNLYFTSA